MVQRTHLLEHLRTEETEKKGNKTKNDYVCVGLRLTQQCNNSVTNVSFQPHIKRGSLCDTGSSHRADPHHSAEGFALSDAASLRLDADQVRQVLQVEEQQVVAKVQEGQTLSADTKHNSTVMRT